MILIELEEMINFLSQQKSHPARGMAFHLLFVIL